jgi:hypothetical protein
VADHVPYAYAYVCARPHEDLTKTSYALRQLPSRLEEENDCVSVQLVKKAVTHVVTQLAHSLLYNNIRNG